MNVSLTWWGMTKNAWALHGYPVMSTLSHDHAPRKHVFAGGRGGKSEGLDSDLGPDAILCPSPCPPELSWLRLMLPAGGACVCGRNCPPPAITPLEAWSQYWNGTWAAVIGQWLHPCTAALLTQGMIHKWFFSYHNGWQRPGNESHLSEKSWSWAKGLAKISGRT